jgi:hypothetical protein
MAAAPPLAPRPRPSPAVAQGRGGSARGQRRGSHSLPACNRSHSGGGDDRTELPDPISARTAGTAPPKDVHLRTGPWPRRRPSQAPSARPTQGASRPGMTPRIMPPLPELGSQTGAHFLPAPCEDFARTPTSLASASATSQSFLFGLWACTERGRARPSRDRRRCRGRGRARRKLRLFPRARAAPSADFPYAGRAARCPGMVLSDSPGCAVLPPGSWLQCVLYPLYVLGAGGVVTIQVHQREVYGKTRKTPVEPGSGATPDSSFVTPEKPSDAFPAWRVLRKSTSCFLLKTKEMILKKRGEGESLLKWSNLFTLWMVKQFNLQKKWDIVVWGPYSLTIRYKKLEEQISVRMWNESPRLLRRQ